jgi:hypothetical protein
MPRFIQAEVGRNGAEGPEPVRNSYEKLLSKRPAAATWNSRGNCA